MMNHETQADGSRLRLAPVALKAVLRHVTERREPLTPESFSTAYAQWAKQRGMTLDVQYTSELAALDHALRAFGDLLIDSPWLNTRVRTLGALAGDGRGDAAVRTRDVKHLLNEVMLGKPHVLGEAGRAVSDIRRIVREVLTQVQELAYHLNVSQTALDAALKRAEEVGSTADLRRELDVMSAAVARLNRSMKQGRERLLQSMQHYRRAGEAVFGAPAPETVARVEAAARAAA